MSENKELAGGSSGLPHISTVTIDSWSQTLVPKRTIEEFEYDDHEFSFPQNALDRIEQLMVNNQSFSVSFNTEIDQARSGAVNSLLFHAAGYERESPKP